MVARVKLLAFDTSSSACSVALMDTAKDSNNQVTFLHKIMPMQQGRLILPMIQALLGASKLSLSDLDAIAYGCGPGSFTGIRIASSVAQGIGFSVKKCQVIPISSLAAIAQTAYVEQQWEYLLTALDARMGQVYWASYIVNQQGTVELRDKESIYLPKEVPPPDLTKKWYGVGDGWATYGDILNNHLGLKAMNTAQVPTATAILQLAKVKYEQREWVRPSHAVPVYLR